MRDFSPARARWQRRRNRYRWRGRPGTAMGPAAFTCVQIRRPTLSASAMTLSSSIVSTLPVPHDELTVDHHRLDVGRLTVVDPRRHDASRRHEVGTQGVERQGGRPSSRPRASRASLPCCTARAPPSVASSSMSSGCGRTPGNASSRRMRSVSSAIRITSNRSLVLLSVPFAMGQPAARSAGMGGMTPRFAAMPAWCEMIVPERPSNAISPSSTYRQCAANSRGPRKPCLSRNAGGRTPWCLHHEVDLGAALRQVNRVSEIVFLGEGADGLQQLGRRGLGERGGREHADASLIRAVPLAEQVVDALQALVSQLRLRTSGLHSWRALPATSGRPRSRCRGPTPRTRSAGRSAPTRRRGG